MLPFLIRERAFLFSLRAVPQKVGLLVLLVAPLATWMLRNKVVTGRFQLTSVTDQMVWMGVQEETEGSGQLPGGENYLDLLSMAERRALFNMDPVARDTFFRDKWRSEVREQPGLRWRMFLVKLRNFWLFRSQPGADHHAATWTLVSFKVYATAMLLLLLLALALRDRALRSLLWSVFLLSVVQCAFYFETRHRLLVEPLLLLVVLASCAELFQRLKRPHPAEQAQ